MIQSEFNEMFLVAMEAYGKSLEAQGQDSVAVSGNEVEFVADPESLNDMLTLPGVRYSGDPATNRNAIALDYVQVPFAALVAPAKEAKEEVEEAMEHFKETVEGAQELLEDMRTDYETLRRNAQESIQRVNTTLDALAKIEVNAAALQESVDVARSLIAKLQEQTASVATCQQAVDELD